MYPAWINFIPAVASVALLVIFAVVGKVVYAIAERRRHPKRVHYKLAVSAR